MCRTILCTLIGPNRRIKVQSRTRVWCPAVTARLRPTWVPDLARRYRQAGGPWDVPTLDALLSAHAGEVVDGATRLAAGEADALVAMVAGGLRERGVGRGDAVAWQL